MLTNRHLAAAREGNELRRPGSAPPQAEELPGSPMADGGLGAMFSEGGLDAQMPFDRSYLSSDEYLRFYYANRNMNPRLPQPISTREGLNRGWADSSSIKDPFTDNQVLGNGDAHAAAALNILFGSQLGLKDSSNGLSVGEHSLSVGSPSQQQSLAAQESGTTQFPGSPWAAPPSSTNEPLESFLQSYSPKVGLGGTSISDALTGGAGAGPSSLFASTGGLHDGAHGGASAVASLAESLLAAAHASSSAPHTPRTGSFSGTAGMPGAAQLFDPAASSSPHGTPLPGSPLVMPGVGKDPKVSLHGFHSGTPRAIGEQRPRNTPSKLRIGSVAHDVNNGSVLGDNPGTPAASVAANNVDTLSQQAAALSEAFAAAAAAGLPTVPDQASQAHQAVAAAAAAAAVANGHNPADAALQAGLLGAAAGVPMQHQMQAQMQAYMAAMYSPYYSPGMQGGMANFPAAAAMQAMQSMGSGYPGYSPMMGGFPPVMSSGFPPMMPPYGVPPGMEHMAAMRPPFGPGGMPGMMPPPFGPGMAPHEYMAFYQKYMEASMAAQMAAAVKDGNGKEGQRGMEGSGSRGANGSGEVPEYHRNHHHNHQHGDGERDYRGDGRRGAGMSRDGHRDYQSYHQQGRDGDRPGPRRGDRHEGNGRGGDSSAGGGSRTGYEGGMRRDQSNHGHHNRRGGYDRRDDYGSGSGTGHEGPRHQRGSEGGEHREQQAARGAGGSSSGGPGAGRPRGSARTDPVLEEYKTNKARRFEFSDILGHIFEFSLDQHGSRFIQQKLESVPKEELAAAFNEVLPRCVTLMTDVFGNYVIQKFLEHGSEEQRTKLAEVLKGQVLQLSLQMYGCRVVQKALEVMHVEQQCAIIAELDGNVMRCVRDQNGNHVIQKVIECVPMEHIQALLDSFSACVVQLSTHPFGCRVMQRILEHCHDAMRRGVVMEEILKATPQLAMDQYGNYVIQHVLERGSLADRQQVVQHIAPQIVAMSMHKFASNVVERCLVHCAPAERDVLIKAMLGAAAASTAGSGEGAAKDGEGSAEGATAEDGSGVNDDPLQQMMKDQFGNYVVQKVLEVCDEPTRDLLLGRVRAQLHALKKYTFGKHIVARVEKLLSAGSKIQSHLKSRPLPDDATLMSARAASSAAAVAASNAGSSVGGSSAPASVITSSGGSSNATSTAASAGTPRGTGSSEGVPTVDGSCAPVPEDQSA